MTTLRNPPGLAKLALVALLVLTLSGCTTGTTTIVSGQASVFVECPSTGNTNWRASAAADRIRLTVTAADTDLVVGAYLSDGPNGRLQGFGDVWDGSGSTGARTVYWQGSFLLVLEIWPSTAVDDITISYRLTAIDPDDRDVGFVSC